MSVKKYFTDIKEALDSTFTGMGVTLDNFFKKPMTYDYYAYGDKKRMPKLLKKAGYERFAETLSDGYRGLLEVDTDICTGCTLCEKACPIGIINIVKEKNEDKRFVVTRFDIDNAKCMFCGLCSIPCPTGAIQHTKEFEATNFYIENLTYEWAGEGFIAYNAKKDGEKERVALGSKMEEKMIKFDVKPEKFYPTKAKAPKEKKVKLKAPPVVSGNRKSRVKQVEAE